MSIERGFEKGAGLQGAVPEDVILTSTIAELPTKMPVKQIYMNDDGTIEFVFEDGV